MNYDILPEEVRGVYKALREASDFIGETSDCSVISLALVAGLTYPDAYSICEEYGRKRNRGMYTHETIEMLEDMGYRVIARPSRKPEEYPDQPTWDRRQYTMRTICKRFTRGTYLVTTRGHIAAMIDGVVIDWTNNRLHRVEQVLEVIDV